MGDDMVNKDEVLKFFQQQGKDQVSYEDFVKMFLLSPLRTSSTKVILSDGNKKRVISETREGVVINSQGSIEEIKEVVHTTLDDGSSLNGIAICQTCEGTVREENLRRCTCGRTCCIRPECGVYSNGKWYCSGWHAFCNSLWPF